MVLSDICVKFEWDIRYTALFTLNRLNIIYDLTDEPFAADLAPGSTLRRLSPPDTPPAVNQSLSQSLPVSQAQWIAEFNQESHAAASEMLSPPMKPVNFEFQTPVAVDPVG